METENYNHVYQSQILMSVMDQIIHVIPMLTVLTVLAVSHAHV